MTSLRSDLLEMIERAWYLIRTRGAWAGPGLSYYSSSTYKVVVNRHDGTFSIICMKGPGTGRGIYYMTADGGPGFTGDAWELERVLRGMRADTVLDELAAVLAKNDDAAQLGDDGLDLVLGGAGVELEGGRVDLGHAATGEDSGGNDEQGTGEKLHGVVLVRALHSARRANQTLNDLQV